MGKRVAGRILFNAFASTAPKAVSPQRRRRRKPQKWRQLAKDMMVSESRPRLIIHEPPTSAKRQFDSVLSKVAIASPSESDAAQAAGHDGWGDTQTPAPKDPQGMWSDDPESKDKLDKLNEEKEDDDPSAQSDSKTRKSDMKTSDTGDEGDLSSDEDSKLSALWERGGLQIRRDLFSCAPSTEGILMPRAHNGSITTLKVWDRSPVQPDCEGMSDVRLDVTCSDSQSLLLSGGTDGAIKVWGGIQSQNQKPLLLATLRGHLKPVREIAIEATSALCVSGGSDGVCKVWDIAVDGRSIRSLEGHRDVPITGVVANGGITFTCSKDKMLHIWDLRAATKVATPAVSMQLHDMPLGLAVEREWLYVLVEPEDSATIGTQILTYDMRNLHNEASASVRNRKVLGDRQKVVSGGGYHEFQSCITSDALAADTTADGTVLYNVETMGLTRGHIVQRIIGTESPHIASQGQFVYSDAKSSCVVGAGHGWLACGWEDGIDFIDLTNVVTEEVPKGVSVEQRLVLTPQRRTAYHATSVTRNRCLSNALCRDSDQRSPLRLTNHRGRSSSVLRTFRTQKLPSTNGSRAKNRYAHWRGYVVGSSLGVMTGGSWLGTSSSHSERGLVSDSR
mmetsp:Transcript_21360/g.50602  ORF Transcript_21360/g.50602 Transcript_21360/m.50602 type:complete len:619 (-) Transcript_21360:2-1858(-)